MREAGAAANEVASSHRNRASLVSKVESRSLIIRDKS